MCLVVCFRRESKSTEEEKIVTELKRKPLTLLLYSPQSCFFSSILNYTKAVKEFSKSKLRKKDKANLFKLGPRGRGRGRRGPEAPSPLTSESSPLDLIRGEVAILKKLHHPNIVKLYEVLDVSAEDSMYMGKSSSFCINDSQCSEANESGAGIQIRESGEAGRGWKLPFCLLIP